MLYLSLVMGLLVGYLVDTWLARCTLKDPWRLVIAVVVGVVVTILTYNGNLRSF